MTANAGANVTSAAAPTAPIGPLQGVSFGGAGFLILYYVGIVEVLTKLGVLQPGTQIAGASSGALITTSICSGLGTPDMLAAGLDLARTCRQQSRCAGSLDKHLRALLSARLPPDAWKRCSGSGWIALSQVLPMLTSNDHQPQPLLVSDFSSQADLIAAAAASSYIPVWSHWSKVALFRGLPVIDGSVASPQPCPPGVQCIRISSSSPAWPRENPMASFVSQFVASVTTAETGPRSLPAITSTGPDGSPDPALLRLAAEQGIDIAPGIYNVLPFSQRDWSSMIISPPNEVTQMYVYRLGKADAEGWARSKGLMNTATSAGAATVRAG